jgi:hypothetical protein
MQTLYYPVVVYLRVQCLVFTSINQNCIADAYQGEASHLDSPQVEPIFGEEFPGFELGCVESSGVELGSRDFVAFELGHMEG